MDLNHQEKSLHSRKPSTPKKTPFGVEVQVTSVIDGKNLEKPFIHSKYFKMCPNHTEAVFHTTEADT